MSITTLYTADRRKAQRQAAKKLSRRRQFSRICRKFDWRCAYCGRPNHDGLDQRFCLDRDHVVARSVGGGGGVDNIVPACRPCQIAKGAGQLWTEFVPSDPHPELVRRFPAPLEGA